jgi:hypothetical protein
LSSGLPLDGVDRKVQDGRIRCNARSSRAPGTELVACTRQMQRNLLSTFSITVAMAVFSTACRGYDKDGHLQYTRYAEEISEGIRQSNRALEQTEDFSGRAASPTAYAAGSATLSPTPGCARHEPGALLTARDCQRWQRVGERRSLRWTALDPVLHSQASC